MGLPVDQLCVEVQMIEDVKSQQHKPKDVQNTENKPIKSYKDLLYRKENLVKRIFLRGKAGYGKTCYALRLVNTWTNAWSQKKVKEEQMIRNFDQDDCNVMLDFDFVFYVAFRFLEKEHKSVVDIICNDYFLSDSGQSQDLRQNMETVLRSNHYKCIVILDGLDESKRADLPVRGHMENCQLLYTSRPSKLDVIDPKYAQDDKIVDILGLGDDLSELVENILGQYYELEGTEKQEKHKSVMNKLKSISTQQQVLLKIPILVPYLIVQICENDEGVFTETLTAAYLGIFQMLIAKAIKEGRLPHTMLEKFKENKDCTKHFSPECRFPLFSLGELAYTDLLKSALLVFKEQELKKMLDEDVIEFAIKTGLICQSNVIGTTTGEKSANFMHKSMQEFLAAFYLTCHKKVFDKFLNEHLHTIEKYINMSEVCAFLSGLKPEFGLEMSERIVELANVDERVLKQRQGLFDDDFTYSDRHVLKLFSYIQCRCCKEFIAGKGKGKFSITDVVISEGVSEEYLRYLTDGKTTCHKMLSLQGTKHEYRFHHSIIRNDEDGKQVCTCVSSESDVNEIIMNSHMLETLVLSNLSFEANCALHPRPVPTTCISWPSTLSVLSIKDVKFERATFRALNKFLTNDNGLNVLQLRCVRDANYFEQGLCIAGCKNLQKLVLGKELSSSGMYPTTRDREDTGGYQGDKSAYRGINQLLSGDNALHVEVLHLNDVKTNDTDEKGICISGCKELRELCCRNIGISYIDLTHCNKLSTIQLTNLYMQNKSPHNRDRQKVEIIFPESTEERGLHAFMAHMSYRSEHGNVPVEDNTSIDVLTPQRSHHVAGNDANVPLCHISPLDSTQKRSFDGKTIPPLVATHPQVFPRGTIANINSQTVGMALPHHYGGSFGESMASTEHTTQGSSTGSIVKMNHPDIQISLSKDPQQTSAREKNTPFLSMSLTESSQQRSVGNANVLAGVISLPRKSKLRILQVTDAKMQKINLTPFTDLQNITFVQVDIPHNEQSRSLCSGEGFMHEINLTNNKNLTNLKLDFSTKNKTKQYHSISTIARDMTDAYMSPSKNEDKKLPIEITLPHDSKVQCIELDYVRLDKLDLKPVTRLRTLNLSDSSVSEVDLPPNTELSQFNMKNSLIHHIDLATAVFLEDVSVGFMSSKEEFKSYKQNRNQRSITSDPIQTLRMGINLQQTINVQSLTINNTSFEYFDLLLITNCNLRQLTLNGVNMSLLDLPHNTGLTTLNVSDSCIRQLNLGNALKLTNVTLGFVSSTMRSGSTITNEGMQLVEKIALPNNLCLQRLTIESAIMQKLDLSPVSALRELSLRKVTISDIDISKNTELTDLYAIDSSISHLNLTTAAMLRVINLRFGFTADHRLIDEISIESNTSDTQRPKPTKITFLHSTREEENGNLSEESLPQSTQQNIDDNIASLAISLPGNNNVRNLTIENAILEKVNFVPFIHLEKLNLQRVVSTEIVVSHKEQMTDFCLKESNFKKLYLQNNTKLVRVLLSCSYAIRKEINDVQRMQFPMRSRLSHSKEDQEPPMSVEIHLLQNPHIQYLNIKNANMERLNLTSVTHLRKVELENVTLPEIDFSHNKELREVHLVNSCVWHINIANVLMMREMSLCVKASTEQNISNLTIEYEKKKMLRLSTVPTQHNLMVPDVTMPEMEVSQNAEDTTLYVGDSSMRYIDVANANMLRVIHLSFESLKREQGRTKSSTFAPIFSFTRRKRDNCGDAELPVEISLPHNSYLQNLTIETLHLQQLDLSPVPNLSKLTLNDITMSEMIFSANSKLTELYVINSCINRMNLSNAVMLRVVVFNWKSSEKRQRYMSCDAMGTKTKNMDEIKPVEFNLPHSTHLHSLTMRARLQELNLSSVTNLRFLNLQDVTVPEIHLPKNIQLTELQISQSCIRHLNLANGVLLHSLQLNNVSTTQNSKLTGQDHGEAMSSAVEINLPYSHLLEDLSINETCLKYLDMSPVDNLRVLQLCDVSLPLLNLPPATDLTELYVQQSCIPYLNLENGLSLLDVHLGFSPSILETNLTDEHEEKQEEQLQVEIKLPYSSQIQRLYISFAVLQTLDLSRSTTLYELSLHNVSISQIDLSQNTELTKLSLYCNAIPHVDIFKSGVGEDTSKTKLDVSQNKKLVSIDLTNISLASSPDLQQASTVKLSDVKMEYEEWMKLADSFLSIQQECKVILNDINDKNIVAHKLKMAGYPINEYNREMSMCNGGDRKECWVYPL